MMQQEDQQGRGMMGSGMGMNPEMMQMMQQMMGQRQGRMEPAMMGRRGMMSGMGHAGMMRIMFAVVDADGDGSLTLDEIQEAHARIFKHVDDDSNGRVTPEEVQAFFRGTPPVADSANAGDMSDMDE